MGRELYKQEIQQRMYHINQGAIWGTFHDESTRHTPYAKMAAFKLLFCSYH